MKKATLFGVVMMALTALAPLAEAQSAITGTWSGNWTPKGGVPDAVTIEIRQGTAGAVTGKFLNPAGMDFSKATFNAKTGVLAITASDQKSGKQYKLDGKVEGNEIKGTLGTGDTSGEIRLIKWTFFGR
jgi:hypothetical protein